MNPRQDRDGNLRYRLQATGVVLVLLLSSVSAPAQRYTEKVLYSFTGIAGDGWYPYAGVVRDPSGNLYGTTNLGSGNDGGTIFELSSDSQENWTEKVLSGVWPGIESYAGLIRDSNGNLYGTTAFGHRTAGIVFELQTDENLRVLHFFRGQRDGEHPYAGLLMDSGGNLYGTTGFGGGGRCMTGCGTVFRINSAGTETVLHRFHGGNDGAVPLGDLIQDPAGDLYGTTYYGGPGSGRSGHGFVFKLSKSGRKTILHRFTGSPDGSHPSAGLIRDAAGNLYGTTIEGGAFKFGTVFKLNKDGKETVLYSFMGGPDGAYPEGDLIEDSNGNFYGVTNRGGTADLGTVFMLDEAGKESVLYSFRGGASDGLQPYGGLAMDSVGNLYGTTGYGGSGACTPSGCGTVFELTPQ